MKSNSPSSCPSFSSPEFTFFPRFGPFKQEILPFWGSPVSNIADVDLRAFKMTQQGLLPLVKIVFEMLRG